jgi:hypothetical protein
MKQIVEALIKFQQEVGPIHRESSAQYGKYADLQTVLATVNPVLNANGLLLTQLLDGKSLITVVHHISGEHLASDCDLVITEGRNALHSWGGAVTFQRRYSILSILGLATEDDDGDSAGHKLVKHNFPGNADDFF